MMKYTVLGQYDHLHDSLDCLFLLTLKFTLNVIYTASEKVDLALKVNYFAEICVESSELSPCVFALSATHSQFCLSLLPGFD